MAMEDCAGEVPRPRGAVCLEQITMLCSRPSFLRKNVTPYLIRGRNPGPQSPDLWMPDQSLPRT